MNPKQKYYFAAKDWLERMEFFLDILDDDKISDYFKERMFAPMGEELLLESASIKQLRLEAWGSAVGEDRAINL